MLYTILTTLAFLKLFWPLINTIYKSFRYIYCQFYPIDIKKYGSWAVITGGSDGIGKAYALELAKRGLNILVIARTEKKLVNVCMEAKNNYDVSVDYIVFDFKDDVYDELKLAIEHKPYYHDIAILVNNVGILPYAYDPYGEKCSNFENLQQLVESNYKINIKPQSLVTGIILPSFLARRRGIIVCMSSVAATEPQGFWTLYSASKGYNYYFNQSLNQEFKLDDYKNLIAQTVRPAVVLTNMAPKFAKESFRFPTPETFAKFSISTIGYFDVTNGYYGHSVMCNVLYDLLGFLKYYETLVINRVRKIRASRAARSSVGRVSKLNLVSDKKLM